ncbi:AAA family ATPase [Acinetobacter modestus]|uniref:AAA family ATPase n=1 Tax=Acinetobacter modestus TaxID=1776740 RepID=UPI00320803BE
MKLKMIVGIFLRNVKTYRKITYIPLSDGEKFCSLLGDNGAGKSSILEALDSFFNGKPITPNLSYKQTPDIKNLPSITPIFLLDKNIFEEEDLAAIERIHNFLIAADDKTDVPAVTKQQFRRFLHHIESLKKYSDFKDKLLFCLGYDYKENIHLSIFHHTEILLNKDEVTSESKLDIYNDLLKNQLEAVRSYYEYIYIPREIDTESFTKLETNEIQKLMGENLYDELGGLITKNDIREINTKLNGYITSLSNDLVEYTYRTAGLKQQYLKPKQLYDLVIQAFFNIRKLFKKEGGDWLEINNLSSGEKQKALIDIAEKLLEKRNKNNQNVILAIDEPESSLHMSSCYDLFDQLYSMSTHCHQLIITTHWYGFLPIIEKGNASVITRSSNDQHNADLINLYHYKEQIRELSTIQRGAFPSNIRLKSTNDLIQSIITSATNNPPYNWLICEGSSEKVYLNYYLEDLIKDKKLRIIPVGGAKAIKQLYNYLSTAYEDFSSEIKGKIFLLSDTDASLVRYPVKNDEQHHNLRSKRLANCSNNFITKLVTIDDNQMTSPTEIEDVLDANTFKATLEIFQSEYDLDFINTAQFDERYCSKWCFTLHPKDQTKLKIFFDHKGIKFRFAKEYIALSMDNNHKPPIWIEEIKAWFNS